MTRDEFATSLRELKPKSEAQQLSDDLDSLPKERLIEIAEQAGVEIDKRWKSERIVTAIKEAAQS